MQNAKIKKSTNINFLSLAWIFIFLIILLKSIFLLSSLYNYKLYIILLYSLFTCSIILLFISFSFFFTDKKSFIYLITLDLLISLLFIVDIIYSRAFGKLISIHMITTNDILFDMKYSIISLIKYTDLLLFSDMPFLFIILFKIKKIKIKRKKKLFLLAFISNIFIIFIQFAYYRDDQFANFNNYAILMSPLGYHIYDVYKYYSEQDVQLEVKEINQINDWFNNNYISETNDSKYKQIEGIAKGKNIIVIQFESLENVLINNIFYNQEITPNINKLLKNSIYFTNIYSQVRDGNSSDAELMFNTSIYPLNVGSAFLRFEDVKYNSLPYILKSYGYTTIAIHGDEKEFWNRDQVYPSLGYKKYIHQDEFIYKESEGMGISDESLFLQSFYEIKKLKNPYLFNIITLTSHMPFKISEDKRYLKNIPYDDTTNYFQSIYYTDKVLGDFYNTLKTSGYLDNAIIVIYGDHEGVHKYYDTYLPDNNNQVPFIIHIPGLDGFKIDKIGGQVDIMPTLLYLLGIENKDYYQSLMGKNLFNSGSGYALMSSGEIIGEAKNIEHLTLANKIADLIIRGNYFSNYYYVN